MKPIVLFGTGRIAEVVLQCFRDVGERQVVACTVDRRFAESDCWNDIPCVPFDELEARYSPADVDVFVAVGYQDLNGLREQKIQEVRERGFQLTSFVHPQSGLPTDCRYGANCFVMSHVMIHPRVTLGDNVFVWSGAMIGHHSVIGSHCWLSSSANVSGGVTVGSHCFFAVNSTVGHSVNIGRRCFLGANSLVTKDAEDDQAFVVQSTPAFRLNSEQFLRMSRFSSL